MGRPPPLLCCMQYVFYQYILYTLIFIYLCIQRQQHRIRLTCVMRKTKSSVTKVMHYPENYVLIRFYL